jgi:hypothetical protein
MPHYCLDCDARLPDRYAWNFGDPDRFWCDECHAKRWGMGQNDDDDEENEEDCE